MRNHQSRPNGSTTFPEVNVVSKKKLNLNLETNILVEVEIDVVVVKVDVVVDMAVVLKIIEIITS